MGWHSPDVLQMPCPFSCIDEDARHAGKRQKILQVYMPFLSSSMLHKQLLEMRGCSCRYGLEWEKKLNP
jgi:hypothetical protein